MIQNTYAWNSISYIQKLYFMQYHTIKTKCLIFSFVFSFLHLYGFPWTPKRHMSYKSNMVAISTCLDLKQIFQNVGVLDHTKTVVSMFYVAQKCIEDKSAQNYDEGWEESIGMHLFHLRRVFLNPWRVIPC